MTDYKATSLEANPERHGYGGEAAAREAEQAQSRKALGDCVADSMAKAKREVAEKRRRKIEEVKRNLGI